MNSSRIIAQGVLWTTILNVVNALYGFVSVPILIALYGKSDFGLIGLAISINVYLRLMDLGFNSTNIRYFSSWLAKGNYSNVNKLFRTSLSFYGSIGLINAIILLIISYFSNYIFNLSVEQDIIIKHLLYILSISAFLSWFSSCFDQLIKGNEHVGWTQMALLLPKCSQFIILFLTITFHFSIELYYGLTALSLILVIPFMIAKIKSINPFISFSPSFDKVVFKEVLPYSLNIFSLGIFQFSIIYLRPIFLGILSSPDSITEYQIMDGIVKVVLLFGGAVGGVILPSASRIIAKHDDDAKNKIAYQGTKYVSIMLSFCCFGMISVTPDIISLYVGPEYLYIVKWLDLWIFITICSHNQAISGLILADTNIKMITISTMFAAIIGLILCWFLIPYYGVGGTVISYGVYLVIQLLFYYLYYWPVVMKLNSLKVFGISFAPYVLLGLICSLILRTVIIEGSLCSLIVKGVAFCLIYFLSILLILPSDDKRFLFNLMKRK